LIGGPGNDVIHGDAGDDVLIGGPGVDTLDGGTGSNVLIDGESLVSGTSASSTWLTNHVHEADGATVLDNDGATNPVPAADLPRWAGGARPHGADACRRGQRRPRRPRRVRGGLAAAAPPLVDYSLVGYSLVGPVKCGARFSRCDARPSAASGPPNP